MPIVNIDLWAETSGAYMGDNGPSTGNAFSLIAGTLQKFFGSTFK